MLSPLVMAALRLVAPSYHPVLNVVQREPLLASLYVRVLQKPEGQQVATEGS